MRVVILILVSLILSLGVEAIAVASDYLESNTLVLIEGTSKIYKINLQNSDSYEIRYKLDYNNEYMQALDFKDEYILSPKSAVGVEFNVTAPKFNKNNNLFDVSFTVHQLNGPAGGGIPFLPKIHKQFKLKVVKDPERLHINYLYVAYGLILLIIIFFLYKKKK